jgi:hypothetical protein
MFAVYDKLQSGGLERAQLIRWIPGQPVVLTDFTGKVNSVGPGPSADKAMAFAVRGVGTSASPKIQMAVVTEANDDQITIYEIQNPSNPSFSSNFVKGTISRSALPTNYDFFTGYTQNTGDVYSEAPQQGNGGDMMFNRDGSKVIFVTRSLVEDLNTRPQYSAIYEYGLTSGQIDLLYNDVAQEERQPIFVDGTGIIPEPEQVITVSPNSLNFGTVNIGTSSTKRVTITNTGTVDANITEVVLGPIAEYAITANSLGLSAPYAFTLAPAASAWFDVTYTPVVAGSPTSGFTVNWATDKSTVISMTGTGKTVGSVSRHYEEVFTFGVAPNPVKSATTITLKGVETSFATLELVDASGRAVWTASGKLTAGSTSTFEMNAQELAAGSYFLVVRAADVQAVGQVVITK